MNCIQPSAPAEETLRLVPKAVSILLIDGEHLPGDPVLGAAGLVDRQQEGRDLEGVDDEVGDADRGGAELRDGQAGVGVGRRAVGVAEGRLLDLLLLGGRDLLGALALLGLLAEEARALAGSRGLLAGLAAAAAPCRRRAAAGACRRCRSVVVVLPPEPPPPVVVVVLPPEPPEVGALYSEISSGPLHPGSARSTRPSPSSSLRFEQAGRAAVVGALTWALPTVIEVAVPAAIIARAAPKAMVTRSFLVIWLADPGPRTWVCWSRPPRTRRHAGRY